jgi:hypothetical protein
MPVEPKLPPTDPEPELPMPGPNPDHPEEIPLIND